MQGRIPATALLASRGPGRLWVLPLLAVLGLLASARAESSGAPRKRRSRTRFVKVVVKDLRGNPLPNAEITVVDFETKEPLPNQKYSVDEQGAKRLVVRTSPDVELVVTAPGMESRTQIVYWSNQYELKLREQGAAAITPATPVVTVRPPVARKTRTVSVVVEDQEGKRLKDAEVAVVDLKTKKIYERKFLIEGLGAVELKEDSTGSLELVAIAPGRLSSTQELGEGSSYVFKLKRREPEVAPIVRKKRTLSIVIEGEDGQRLKGAEVAVVDSKTKKIHERKLLGEGLGSVEFEEDAAAAIELVAAARGRESSTQAVGEENSYVFKLKRREVSAKLSVLVKDSLGRTVSGATVIAIEGGRKLASKATDDDGHAEVSFVFGDPSDLVLEVRHGAYRPRKTPVRPDRDQKLEVVLMPSRPAVKSSLVTVLVLSKSFTASPQTFAKVRAAVARLLEDCAKDPELWRDVALVTVGDGRIREILPLTRKLGDAEIKQAKARLSGLYGHAGTLSWRDLGKLAQFLGNSRALGDAGAEVVVLAPKNMVLDEKLSLYDAGGDSVMGSFRQNNLRLRLIEIGFTEDRTRAYRELCEKTQGFYRAVKIGDKLDEQVARLQFHFPTPPPSPDETKK